MNRYGKESYPMGYPQNLGMKTKSSVFLVLCGVCGSSMHRKSRKWAQKSPQTGIRLRKIYTLENMTRTVAQTFEKSKSKKEEKLTTFFALAENIHIRKVGKIICFILITWGSFAKELGSYGETIAITEPDLIKIITNVLEKKSLFHDTSHVTQKAKEPKALLIPHAVKHTVHTIDPSITLQQDYRDHKGRIFSRKGETINPLKTTPLRTPLLFLDCRDKEHITWALRQKGKKICIAGSPSRCMDAYSKTRFFFDYNGLLSTKLRITHVPAKVVQKALTLSVHTVPLHTKGERNECESCNPCGKTG